MEVGQGEHVRSQTTHMPNRLSVSVAGASCTDFLGVRFSVQWLNRFASIYLEDPSLSPEEAGQVGALQMRVIEALAFEKNLLQLAVISRSVQDEVDQDAVSTYLAATNTTYSSTNLPRMGDRWG